MDYREIVKKVVMRFGHDKTREDREDFEQECELIIFEKWKAIEELPDESKEKFIYTICKNKLYDLLRKDKPALSMTDEAVLREADSREKVQNMDEVLDGETITRFLNTLPEPYATILALRFGIDCDPRTQQEIADRFFKSREWVKKQEQEALERLRELMKCK